MTPARHDHERAAPIGVFDSGIGGLSVLRALTAALPHERFVYFADSGHAPYGERNAGYVIDRSRAALTTLRQEHGIKALVIACNTATALAADPLRAEHPGWPIVGIEPALKPAVAATHTGRVGVLATRGTLASARFGALQQRLADQAEIVTLACDGLANAIENEAQTQDSTPTQALIDRYLGNLGALGDGPACIDTVVLGCTHYPLALPHFVASLAGRAVTLIDPAQAVARRTQHVLHSHALAQPADHPPAPPAVRWLTTGQPAALQAAVRRWLPEVSVFEAFGA